MQFIDLVLIPILDGEQDMLNALDTYKYLKSIKPDIKIIFVLNRVKDSAFIKQQFDHFFGDSRDVFSNFLDASEFISTEELSLYISFVESDVIRFSRRFGLTAYEISNIEKPYLDNILESDNPKVASFKHYMSRSCKKYYEEVLIKSFEVLDTKLGR